MPYISKNDISDILPDHYELVIAHSYKIPYKVKAASDILLKFIKTMDVCEIARAIKTTENILHERRDEMYYHKSYVERIMHETLIKLNEELKR